MRNTNEYGKKVNATRRQVGLGGSNLLPPPQVCQTSPCLWWGHLVISKLLKSALATRVKVYHFGSDDGFHMCSESGMLQPSIVYDNLAYKDPCASEMGFSPLKRTECLFPAYSGLRTHKA